MSEFIPFSVASIGKDECDEVMDTLKSGWLTSGPRTKCFEDEFAKYVGASRTLAVNSCTAALHLALRCLDLKPGDEVITTPLTFCATVNTILESGGIPVMADIGQDLNLDPSHVRALVNPRTRAVIPVHFAGLPCEMDDIWQLAEAKKLAVIEDAAHAVGSAYRGQRIGAGASDAIAFSFYATKNLCTGEGGMLATGDSSIAERARRLCLHGISKDAWNRYSEKGSWFYEVTEIGFKYNMSDLMAAIGLHQLRRLEAFNSRRREIAKIYSENLGDLCEVELPPDHSYCVHSWHLYVVRLRLEMLTIDRASVFEEMKRRGVGCSVHFIPIPLHPAYRNKIGMEDPCERAIGVYPRLLSLPIYPSMSDGSVARVAKALREIIVAARVQKGTGASVSSSVA
jgi:dTDP-4-amino-4,6-dideoxygalactose transaminase